LKRLPLIQAKRESKQSSSVSRSDERCNISQRRWRSGRLPGAAWFRVTLLLESEKRDGFSKGNQIDQHQSIGRGFTQVRSMSWILIDSPRLFPGLGIVSPDHYRDFYLLILDPYKFGKSNQVDFQQLGTVEVLDGPPRDPASPSSSDVGTPYVLILGLLPLQKELREPPYHITCSRISCIL
jgi:hypothetical protein